LISLVHRHLSGSKGKISGKAKRGERAMFGDHEAMQKNGFEGFKTIRELDNNRNLMPAVRGVYILSRPSVHPPRFVDPGSGGFFKGNDPNVRTNELQENWVPNTITVYIGKAGSPTGEATLRTRLSQYWSFGQGKRTGHRGGRYVWQLADVQDLVVCWKKTPDEDPREVEADLISQFVEEHGRMPFANLRR
jgi:hypothetical protein